MTDISVCVDCTNMLGENPLWDVATQQLYWIDGMSREIWRCSADGAHVRTWPLPAHVGAIGCMALRTLTDSWRDVLYAFDWDGQAGRPGERRIFASLPARSIPDGGTVDAEGYVWSALNGAFSAEGALIRFAPDGTIDRKIVMPVAKVTSLIFGGRDLDVLYVTSSRIESEHGKQPLDGALFAIRGLGIRGLPERRYAG